MARSTYSRVERSKRHVKDRAKFADNSIRISKFNASTSKARRSSRLKKVTTLYEAEDRNHFVLSSKFQDKIDIDTCHLPMPLLENSHGSSNLKNNSDEIIANEDEINTSMTLIDLLTRCRNKKRKSSLIMGFENANVLKPNAGLDETISSIKLKKARSLMSGEKEGKHTESTLQSLSVEKKEHAFSLISVNAEIGLDKPTLNEEIIDVLPLDSENDPRHTTENEMEDFSEQSLESRNSALVSKDILKTPLDATDDEKSINKSYLDKSSVNKVPCKIMESQNLEEPGLISKFKFYTEAFQKDAQPELTSFDLIEVEKSIQFIESDCGKLSSSLENGIWLAGNKNNFSDTFSYNRIDSNNCADLCEPSAEFCEPNDDCSSSLSILNNGNFKDGMNQSITESNSSLVSIHSPKSLDIGGIMECNMLNGNSDGLLICASNCMSQMDYNILSNDMLAFVNSHCSIVEASSSDSLSESVLSAGNIADFLTGTSSESSSQTCGGRQINMETTETEIKHCPKKLLSNRKEISPNSQVRLLRALNEDGLEDVVKLSNCMKNLCFGKEATNKPLSDSVLDNEETFIEAKQVKKKMKSMKYSTPEPIKGILKSSDTIISNPCCLKNISIHAQDAILFSQRQMQDTESISARLLLGLNSLRSVVEETTISLEGISSSSTKFNTDGIRLATKQASKLEATTKKWLTMMAKDCARFCKIMRLAESKMASPTNDIHKGRKKITFADEAGGALCQVKVYEHQPTAFIFPKS